MHEPYRATNGGSGTEDGADNIHDEVCHIPPYISVIYIRPIIDINRFNVNHQYLIHSLKITDHHINSDEQRDEHQAITRYNPSADPLCGEKCRAALFCCEADSFYARRNRSDKVYCKGDQCDGGERSENYVEHDKTTQLRNRLAVRFRLKRKVCVPDIAVIYFYHVDTFGYLSESQPYYVQKRGAHYAKGNEHSDNAV